MLFRSLGVPELVLILVVVASGATVVSLAIAALVKYLRHKD
ncbi:MAG TPA: hypothetical protein VM537_09910 [Anaerolineae bacterium]|nr:hypothetical protein [Anaerolineae bacterium]